MADDQSLDTLMMIYMARRLDLKYVISYCGNISNGLQGPSFYDHVFTK